MAGSITIGKGASPGYYTRQASRGTDYYSAGAGQEKPGCEPAGIWTGDGCPDLGLKVGAEVDHEAFGFIFGSHVDPRDGSRIGRAMSHRDAETIYSGMLHAEPSATVKRKDELWIQAQAQADKSRSVPFFDATFSVSKSITLLHASARAMKLAAEKAGNTAAAAQAQALEDTVWSAISAGAQAGLAHLQKHAGYTRTGAGGVRQEDAHGWVVASWRQHTSRRGDPQLHIHNTILNKARTERDGDMRTLDGRMLYQERAAAAGIATLVTENQLTRELGVEWVPRADGHGREIEGVSQPLMDEFSSRARQDIAPELTARVEAYRDAYGHDPDELALWKMGQAASRDTRDAKTDADPARQVRDWAQRAQAQAGTALEPLAAQVCGRAAQAQPLSQEAELTLISRAITALQAKRSTFTQSDLTRAISEQLPATLPVMNSVQAAAYLPALADKAIRTGMVAALEPGAWLDVPDSLRRSDGESVYTAHRQTRYATDAQLAMEARILDRAAETGAPSAEPADVARLLGADLAALRAQLEPGTPADTRTVTGCGLHLDQAAAAFAVMTTGRRADVLVGPAGTGKSRTIAAIARIWPQLHPGGRVIALTETQQGANVLRSMGVADSHNISMFLADPRLRDIPARSIVIADEASMVTMPHLDALTRIARQNDAKMMLAGDPAQHQAVTAGGGMAMIARRHGFLQLGEALRFTREWEREASLRLRAGDAAVLAEYDQQGRILAGTAERMTEEAYRRWLGDYLDGKDSVLIAHNQADALELSRRARADLIRYGRVGIGPEAALRDGAVASAGDRIMARKNAHRHTVSNRDIYVVDEVCKDGSIRCRLVTSEGAPRDPVSLSRDYLASQCHLAYGRTSYSVEGETFRDNGYALVRPEDSREFAYTALSRAAGANYAFAVAEEPQLETGAPGAALEVARSRSLAAEQAGESPGADLSMRSGTGVLTRVLARSDAELSATETMAQAFSDADSGAVLSRIWADLTSGEYRRRYDQVLRDQLGDDDAGRVVSDYRYTWLCRTLRAAELAGLASDQVLRQAICQGSLTDAASVAAVLDHRARQIVPGTLPLGGGWTARAPRLPEPGADQLIVQVAQAMDERTARLGEHVAQSLPLWAERNLGSVPGDPVEREDWQLRAGAVAFYRDMTGYCSPGDPIGPAPAATSPEARAAWHTALVALAKVDGIDLSQMTPAQLEVRRAAYGRETARAPVHPGRELRLSIQARDQAAERAARSQREAAIAQDTETRARHLQHAERWASVRDRAATAADQYGTAMETWQNWHQLAEPTLRAGMAADLETRRRDPWSRLEPLRSHEPESPVVAGDPEASDADILTALGLTLGLPEASDHPQRLADAARARQVELDELASLPEPSEDPDLAPAEGWGQAVAREREAVTQPATPALKPSERILEMEAEAG